MPMPPPTTTVMRKFSNLGAEPEAGVAVVRGTVRLHNDELEKCHLQLFCWAVFVSVYGSEIECVCWFAGWCD